MAMLERIYECLNKDCKAQIKLEKRAGGGWNKFNLDGSPHIHPSSPKKQQQQQQQQQQPVEQQQQTKFQEGELASLEKRLSTIEALIRTLISQVQLTRQELQQK